MERMISSFLGFLMLFGSICLGEGKGDHLGRIKENDVGNWTVNDCIMASFSMEFTIYPNNSDHNSSLSLSLPLNAKVDPNLSNCGNETQDLTLKWIDISPENGTQLSRNLTISFHINGTDYGISQIYGKFVLGYWNETVSIKNTTSNTTHNETVVRHNTLSFDSGDLKDNVMLKTPIRHSFVCEDPGVISLITRVKVDNSGPPFGEPVKNTTLAAKKIQFNAFRGPHVAPNIMETPLNCDYRPNDFVPIGVGIGLAVLIVFILVAYLIGRRKARQNGYQSV